mgnify:CR=1 FL=1
MRNRTQEIKAKTTDSGKNYYLPIRYPDIPLSSNDIYVRTTIGDRLDSLANAFYNDVRLWWIISSANPHIVRRDSYALKPNLEIRIPTNITKILNSFKEINK